MYHNLLDKNMFPVHIPKLHTVVLNSRYIYIYIYEDEMYVYIYIYIYICTN